MKGDVSSNMQTQKNWLKTWCTAKCFEKLLGCLALHSVADPGGLWGVQSNPPLAHSLVWKIPIWTFTFAQKYLSGNLWTPARTPLHRILDPPQTLKLFQECLMYCSFWDDFENPVSDKRRVCIVCWTTSLGKGFVPRCTVHVGFWGQGKANRHVQMLWVLDKIKLLYFVHVGGRRVQMRNGMPLYTLNELMTYTTLFFLFVCLFVCLLPGYTTGDVIDVLSVGFFGCISQSSQQSLESQGWVRKAFGSYQPVRHCNLL